MVQAYSVAVFGFLVLVLLNSKVGYDKMAMMLALILPLFGRLWGWW